jgi:hypothetical protein
MSASGAVTLGEIVDGLPDAGGRGARSEQYAGRASPLGR